MASTEIGMEGGTFKRELCAQDNTNVKIHLSQSLFTVLGFHFLYDLKLMILFFLSYIGSH